MRPPNRRLNYRLSLVMQRDQVEISSRDYWFKVVEMLQQNWALIERKGLEERAVKVYFIDDGGGVFDEIDFENEREARRGLRRNGFQRYAKDEEAQEFISPPEAPLYRREHPNGKIYSSGEYWAGPPVSDS